MLSFLSFFVFSPNSQKFEQLVLTKLKWDLMAITPNAFLEHIFHRLPVDKEQAALLRKHAQTFIVLCATGKPNPSSLIKQMYYELSINDTWWWIDLCLLSWASLYKIPIGWRSINKLVNFILEMITGPNVVPASPSISSHIFLSLLLKRSSHVSPSLSLSLSPFYICPSPLPSLSLSLCSLLSLSLFLASPLSLPPPYHASPCMGMTLPVVHQGAVS